MKTTILILIPALLMSCSGKNENFDASGTFEAEEIIISAEVTGTLARFDIHEGRQVEAGELLGSIDTTQLVLKKKQLEAQVDAILSKRPQIATQLASYRIQLGSAERELQRVENLYRAEAATSKQVDDARAQVEVIRRQLQAHRSSLDISSQALVSETFPLTAQIEQLDDQLRRTRIISPIDGTVLNTYAETHELAVTGRPLFKVADLSHLELRAYITGRQLPEIKLGQNVRIYIDNGSGGYREYPGTLTWISETAEFTPKSVQTKDERADLVYAVKARVKNDGYIKIGMYAEVKI